MMCTEVTFNIMILPFFFHFANITGCRCEFQLVGTLRCNCKVLAVFEFRCLRADSLSSRKTLAAMFFPIEIGQVILAAKFLLLKMATSCSCYNRKSCLGRKHSQTIFTIEILIKILSASTCMIVFFCRNMAASN